ncbi:hypothetical protein CDCA_CDCA04G1297 [Cyanidium caldarium]|uniref:Uncharacterized protein n=1 Tax=Cyanidium caldarium TaxID=2771 RepID=A0AAV9ISF2_CYACA|nr:hypothetical protein CDCA_CDCA04G1297 [Cyanidium caldarium]
MAPAIPEKASSVVVAAETAAAPLAMDARSTGEYVIRLEGIHALQSAQERMLRWMARQEESLQTLHKRLDEVERQLRGRCPLPHAAHRAPHRLGTERQTRAYVHYTEGPATPDKCRAHDAHGHDPDATDWVQQAARRLQDIANRVPSTASVDGMHNRAAAAAAAAAPVASGQWIWVSMPAAGAPSEDETGAPWAGTASLTDHDIQRARSPFQVAQVGQHDGQRCLYSVRFSDGVVGKVSDASCTSTDADASFLRAVRTDELVGERVAMHSGRSVWCLGFVAAWQDAEYRCMTVRLDGGGCKTYILNDITRFMLLPPEYACVGRHMQWQAPSQPGRVMRVQRYDGQRRRYALQAVRTGDADTDRAPVACWFNPVTDSYRLLLEEEEEEERQEIPTDACRARPTAKAIVSLPRRRKRTHASATASVSATTPVTRALVCASIADDLRRHRGPRSDDLIVTLYVLKKYTTVGARYDATGLTADELYEQALRDALLAPSTDLQASRQGVADVLACEAVRVQSGGKRYTFFERVSSEGEETGCGMQEECTWRPECRVRYAVTGTKV